MKPKTKYFFCALVSIGLACSMQAKPENEKEQKDKGKSDKVEVVEDKGKEKKEKVLIVKKREGSTTTTPDKPFSVPDAGSTVALLGLSLAAIGLAHRRWRSLPAQRA